MKYYEMHEKVYRDLKASGKISWDRQEKFDELWGHDTNVYLHKFLSDKDLSKLRILDLGTGAGTAALYFARHGAEVVGVDVSSSAIEMAQTSAKALKLNVEFSVADITKLNLAQKFDVVIDSTLLHCLIGSDREAFYEVARQHLCHDGRLFINTMIADDAVHTRFSDKFFVFQDDVLWSLGIDEIGERRVINGKSYFPHRTLLSYEAQISEFARYNFKVQQSELLDGCLVALLAL